MIHAAAKLLCFLGKGEPPRVFQIFTFQRNRHKSFGTLESWGTQVKFEFYYATITYFTA